ncbi:MAG TPA: ABC transporter ATP-binding protein [Candidatus Saccharimonadales bacterium]|nr:ABC transporter ATP-binding protein [Candidatus Saccharimonadales bacterium]
MTRKPYKPLREKETLGIFWQTIWQKHQHLFLGSLIYLIGAIGITVLVPLFISQTLASIITQHGEMGNNLLLLIITAIIGVIGNLTGFLCIIRLNAHLNSDATDMSLEALLKRSVGFHTNNIGGKLVNNAIEYGSAFSKLIDVLYINLIPFVLTLIIGIGVVMSRSLSMGFALLGVTVITITLILVESYRRSGLRAERKRAQDNSIANLSDTIVNAQAVKTFAREKDELQTHYNLNHRLRDLRLKDWTSTGISGSVRMAVLLGLQVIFIVFVAKLVKDDPSVLGIGIFSFAYTLALLNKLFDVGTMLRNLEEAFLSASTMTGILKEEIEIKDAPNAKELTVNKATIGINDISFSYQDDHANENVFSHLSLSIPAGQKVGLVGPSGGGKSTLTRLLLRFDDVTDGAISIDDQDLREVTQESLRHAISYVPQEPLLFHRSILENIAYGKPGATLKEVQQAAKLAYADDFIEKLPQKYDTIVGERGVKLSGGQRQRIAIARAILKDAPILVLDEATSALDSESEVYIQKALAELMKNRTTIVIAHRLSTIQKMDRIVVLADGAIVEDGTHDKLLKEQGTYAKLWAHQSGGFITEEN